MKRPVNLFWSESSHYLGANSPVRNFERNVPEESSREELVLERTVPEPANGQGGRDTRPRFRQLDQQICELWEQYSSGEISTARLLRGCSRLYGPTDDNRDANVNKQVTRL